MASRKAAVAVTLALALLTAGCLGTGAAAPTTNSEPATDGPPTVSVNGVGSVTAAPDVAVVRVSVVATAPTAAAAREQVATDVAAVRDALSSLDASVTTAYFHVAPDYRYATPVREPAPGPEPEPEPERYRASHALRIEVTPDDAGAAVDGATAAGADRVDGVSFTLSDAARQEHREAAIEEAVAAARADADALAGAAGTSVVGLQSASVGSTGYPYPVPYARAEDAAGGAGTPTTFEPDEASVTVSVSVVYELA